MRNNFSERILARLKARKFRTETFQRLPGLVAVSSVRRLQCAFDARPLFRLRRRARVARGKASGYLLFELLESSRSANSPAVARSAPGAFPFKRHKLYFDLCEPILQVRSFAQTAAAPVGGDASGRVPVLGQKSLRLVSRSSSSMPEPSGRLPLSSRCSKSRSLAASSSTCVFTLLPFEFLRIRVSLESRRVFDLLDLLGLVFQTCRGHVLLRAAVRTSCLRASVSIASRPNKTISRMVVCSSSFSATAQ